MNNEERELDLALAEAEQENRLLRARNERLERELAATAPAQESVAWRDAAIRIGEDLCSVGPFGYYDMTAQQWLDWALSVVTVHAPPAPEQEPYGYFRYDIQLDAWVQNKEANVGVAFYTEPPKREWVELTEDEIFKLYMGSGCTDIEDCEGFEKVAKVVEAKLKEKNT